MTTKADLPKVPSALADVALISGPEIAASAGNSLSWYLEEVRAGRAPQPVIRKHRCTRWRLADVRAWLIERAAQAEPDAEVIERAARASAKARTPEAVAKAKATRKANISARATAQTGA